MLFFCEYPHQPHDERRRPGTSQIGCRVQQGHVRTTNCRVDSTGKKGHLGIELKAAGSGLAGSGCDDSQPKAESLRHAVGLSSLDHRQHDQIKEGNQSNPHVISRHKLTQRVAVPNLGGHNWDQNPQWKDNSRGKQRGCRFGEAVFDGLQELDIVAQSSWQSVGQ